MRLTLSVPSRVRACASAAMLALVLGGCPDVDLGQLDEEPGICRPDFAYYKDQIWPQFLAPADTNKSCVGKTGCHQQTTGRSALRLATDPVDHAANYETVTRFLNCGSPEASLLLSKPVAGGTAHGGGDIFANTSDPAVVVFLGWFP